MKIRAIRLKEVGRFSAPIAIEGLSGSLDVLVGPNEFGKSTILKAVKAALFDPHRSKNRKLEVLRPYAGGAPLIEVDFEVAGNPWRIRKQFLSSPAAELRDLHAGSVTRGVDAEARLEELLGGAGRFALLCVDQGTPLASMTPLETGGAAFMAAIESEVESLTDGSAARFVGERVKAELATLLTSHNPPRPTGSLKTALDELASLETQREDAQARLGRAQARLDELEALRGRLAQLADPDAARAREQAANEARRAFEEAREAREKAKLAEQAVASCAKHLGALKQTLDAFDRRAGERAKLQGAVDANAPLLADAEARSGGLKARVVETRQVRDAMKRALAATECSRRLLELSERLEVARHAQVECARMNDALSTNAAEGKLVDAARREAAAIAALEARLSAAAPRVSLNYRPGGAGKIKVGGRALADGETIHPTQPVTLDIEGVGTITIAPGQSNDVARDEAALAAHCDQLGALLKRAGATSLEVAERLHVVRRDVEGKLVEATAQLKSSAPEGIERLQRAHAELAAQAAALDAPATATHDELETRARELVETLGAAEENLNLAARQERTVNDELVSLRARLAGHADQLECLVAELGAPEVQAAARDTKAAAVNEAQAALNTAVREAAAWREKAPADALFAELQVVARTAEAACQRANDEIAGLRRTEAGLEGELRADRDGDVAARLEELNDQCAVARSRCREMQQEAAALQLLMQELDAAATRTRDRFARPVVERLAPYLQLMLPQARLVLADDLSPQALERGAALEEFGRLSGGTQEQLALLVRLAFARLLADTGAPAPLILDDAVTHTDDDRLQRLFATLRHAAQSHQVLVLTCRQSAYEELGGHRIAVRTWEDARAAA
jgi:energy-coupling factor transporter ATP-binding protein EcfA2